MIEELVHFINSTFFVIWTIVGIIGMFNRWLLVVFLASIMLLSGLVAEQVIRDKIVKNYIPVARKFVSRVDRVNQIKEDSLAKLNRCFKRTNLLDSSVCYEEAVNTCWDMKYNYAKKLKELCIIYLTGKGIEDKFAGEACDTAVESYINKVDCSDIHKAYLKQISKLLNKQK